MWISTQKKKKIMWIFSEEINGKSITLKIISSQRIDSSKGEDL